ncbi:MAG: hypothetical protein MHMPM18_004123 [Marteilia pararefringens]
MPRVVEVEGLEESLHYQYGDSINNIVFRESRYVTSRDLLYLCMKLDAMNSLFFRYDDDGFKIFSLIIAPQSDPAMLFIDNFSTGARPRSLMMQIICVLFLTGYGCKKIVCGIQTQYKHRGMIVANRYEALCRLMGHRRILARGSGSYTPWFTFEISESNSSYTN